MSYAFSNPPFPDSGVPGWGQFYQEQPDQFGVPAHQGLTSENLSLCQKEECDLIQSGLFPLNSGFPQQHLAHEDPSAVKSEHEADILHQHLPQHHHQNSGSDNNNSFAGSASEKSSSSPSTTIFNNLPLTSQDLKTLNGNILADSNIGLTEQEIANKRKAQNRAAQRAFRERKETKLKELEDKLKESETDKAQLKKQLDSLKRQNIVISTENKLLLQNPPAVSPPSHPGFPHHLDGEFSFPAHDPFNSIVAQTTKQLHNDEIPYDEKRLTVMETWEYLNSLDLDIDFETVMNRLKGDEVCHVTGAAYKLQLIDAIVEEEKN